VVAGTIGDGKMQAQAVATLGAETVAALEKETSALDSPLRFLGGPLEATWLGAT